MPGDTSLRHAVEASQGARSSQGQEDDAWIKIDYLLFSLGEGMYGFEAQDIQEIIPSPAITHVPTAPEYVSGVFHNRGTVVPAIDLKVLFGLPRPESSMSGRRCIIIQSGKYSGAFIPDSLGGVIGIPAKAIEPPLTSGVIDPAYVKGQVRLKDKTVVILHASSILEGSKVKAAK